MGSSKKDGGGEDVAVGSVADGLIWARGGVAPDVVFGDEVAATMAPGPTDIAVEESGMVDTFTGTVVRPSEGPPGVVKGAVWVGVGVFLWRAVVEPAEAAAVAVLTTPRLSSDEYSS